jgi:hypothetical protein
MRQFRLNVIWIVAIFCVLSHTVRGQGLTDTLFYVYLDHSSKPESPRTYYYKGEKIIFHLNPIIGAPSINLHRQCPSDNYKEVEEVLITGQNSEWSSEYEIEEDGIYYFSFLPDQDLGYLGADFVYQVENDIKKGSSIKVSPGIGPGKERHLSYLEAQERNEK